MHLFRRHAQIGPLIPVAPAEESGHVHLAEPDLLRIGAELFHRVAAQRAGAPYIGEGGVLLLVLDEMLLDRFRRKQVTQNIDRLSHILLRIP